MGRSSGRRTRVEAWVTHSLVDNGRPPLTPTHILTCSLSTDGKVSCCCCGGSGEGPRPSSSSPFPDWDACGVGSGMSVSTMEMT